MSRTVLIVTNSGDIHADNMVQKLEELRVPVLRFHPDEIGINVQVSTSPSDTKLTVVPRKQTVS